jgi:tRNA pseudouridine38-40 synthase
MRNIKMIIEYDGSRYKGWQKQTKDVNTVQGRIEDVLNNITGEEIQLIGCGRTDAGVHALNYTANFHTNSTINNDDLLIHLNDKLPDDIGVISIKNASERFHSRYNILSKINNSQYNNVFERKYIHNVREKLNLEKIRECSEIFIGTHDFQSFTTLKSKTKSTVRTINYINIKEINNRVEIEINGNGFLWNMVRIILGTLIEAGKGSLSKEDIIDIINAKKRSDAGPMVPAKGLFLKDVEY